MSLLLLFAGVTDSQAPITLAAAPQGRTWVVPSRRTAWEPPRRETTWTVPPRKTEWTVE